MPTLKHIYCFPIKSFSGFEVDLSNFQIGSGVENDRRFAITIKEDIDGSKWEGSRNFVVNSVRDGLLKIQLENIEGEWQFKSPNGNLAKFNPEDPNSFLTFNASLPDLLETSIEPSLPLKLVERINDNKAYGMWDYIDTPLSIINLETVRAISKAASEELNPLRFRGNLLIDDLPAWQEFSMSGMRCQLGEAEIEITRPIDRCPATSINPNTGERDIKVPALLAQHFGHGFCGIYAHVVKAGKVRPGDQLKEIGPAHATHLSAQPSNAPDYSLWPKNALISNFETVGDEINCDLITGTSWPLLNNENSSGKRMRLHLGQDNIINATIEKIKFGAISVSMPIAFANTLGDGNGILVSGPFGKTG